MAFCQNLSILYSYNHLILFKFHQLTRLNVKFSVKGSCSKKVFSVTIVDSDMEFWNIIKFLNK